MKYGKGYNRRCSQKDERENGFENKNGSGVQHTAYDNGQWKEMFVGSFLECTYMDKRRKCTFSHDLHQPPNLGHSLPETLSSDFRRLKISYISNPASEEERKGKRKKLYRSECAVSDIILCFKSTMEKKKIPLLFHDWLIVTSIVPSHSFLFIQFPFITIFPFVSLLLSPPSSFLFHPLSLFIYFATFSLFVP